MLSDAAREARRAYKRAWNHNNPEKVKAHQERFYEKKAAEAALPSRKGSNHRACRLDVESLVSDVIAPCPFCGKKPRMNFNNFGELEVWTIFCEPCGLIKRQEGTMAAALVAWNMRVNDDIR